jgi:hypothetical protein
MFPKLGEMLDLATHLASPCRCSLHDERNELALHEASLLPQRTD